MDNNKEMAEQNFLFPSVDVVGSRKKVNSFGWLVADPRDGRRKDEFQSLGTQPRKYFFFTGLLQLSLMDAVAMRS